MDALDALAELTAVSSQVESAALVEDGDVLAATAEDGAALGEAGRALLEQAAGVQGREPCQLAVTTSKGGVFVVREDRRAIVATTVPEASVGLVFYDLKSCLRDVA